MRESYRQEGTPLTPVKKKTGYLCVSLSEGYGKPNQTLIHRFVWEYFFGEIPQGLEVDHKDGNKTNNKLTNLQLLTPKDNTRKANRKLSDEDIREIRSLLGVMSGAALGRKFNVSQQLICCIKKGRRWPDIH